MDKLPESLRDTAMIRMFGITKIPLIAFCSPTAIEISDQRCELKIPLNRRTRNHLHSLYFGVLAIGADLAAGMLAMKIIKESGRDISLVFKDFKADFLKRADGDTHFVCPNGAEVRELVKKCMESGERENATLDVIATVPSKYGDEPVAEMKITLSIKARKK